MATDAEILSALKKLIEGSGTATAAARTAGELGLGDDTAPEFLEKLESIRDAYQDIATLGKSSGDYLEASMDVEKERLRIAKEKVTNLLKEGDISRGVLELAEKHKQKIEEQVRALRDKLDVQRSFVKAQDDAASGASNLGGNLTAAFAAFKGGNIPGAKKAFGGLLGGIKGGAPQVMALQLAMKLTVGSLTLLTGAFTKAYKKAFNLVFMVDQFSASIMKSTGLTREFANVSTNAWLQTGLAIGVTADQAAEATRALSKVYTDFTRLPDDQRRTIEELSTTFLGLGMSTQQFAAAQQAMTKNFGMTTEQANYSLRQLRTFAADAKIPFELMNEQFQQAAPLLARYDDATGVFKRLSIAAKVTGLEMDKITRVALKFDTFEGAATQAGKLNAALGGNFVNAMELMMTTDPVDRFMMIRDSILDTGLAYHDMEYFQKNFFVGAIDGIDTHADLAKMLSGSSQEMEEMSKRANINAESMQKLQKIAFDMLPIMDKVATLVNTMFKDIDFVRLGNALNKILTGLIPIAEKLAPLIAGEVEEQEISGKILKGAVSQVIPGGGIAIDMIQKMMELSVGGATAGKTQSGGLLGGADIVLHNTTNIGNEMLDQRTRRISSEEMGQAVRGANN